MLKKMLLILSPIWLIAAAHAEQSEDDAEIAEGVLQGEESPPHSFVFECVDVTEIEGAIERYRLRCIERDDASRMAHIARRSDESGISIAGDLSWFHDQAALINITQTINAFIAVRSAAPQRQPILKIAGVYSKRPKMKGEPAIETATLLFEDNQ